MLEWPSRLPTHLVWCFEKEMNLVKSWLITNMFGVRYQEGAGSKRKEVLRVGIRLCDMKKKVIPNALPESASWVARYCRGSGERVGWK